MRVLFKAFLLAGMVCGIAPADLAQDDSLSQSRMNANEASAVASLRAINVACVTYSVTYGIGFPAALRYLQTSGPPSKTAASLIDEALAGGVKNGYAFTYTPGPVQGGIVPTYAVHADPLSPGQSGRRHYFTDQSGVIRWNAAASAASADPPIDRASEYTPRPPGGPPAKGEVDANEEWAVAGLRTINTACVTYAATYGTGYPSALKDLGPSRNANAHAANLIDEKLASGTKDGYVFVYTPRDPIREVVPAYTITADPITVGQTGRRHFFTDQSGVVRENASGTASASDPPSGESGNRRPGTTEAKEAAAQDVSPASPAGHKRIRVSPAVTEAKLVYRVSPVYPPLARQARIAGTVHLRTIIATDGSIASLEVISGPPLLIQSALDAVRQWKYKPTLLSGQPVEVQTFIDVTFVLDNNP